MAVPHFSKPRRQFLKSIGVSAPVALALGNLSAAGNGRKTVRIVQFDAAGIRTGVVEVEKIEKPLSEWKKQLTPDSFEVTRRAGTERPYSGQYAITMLVCTAAFAATRFFSIPRPSLSLEPGGPVSGSPLPRKTSRLKLIGRWG